MCRRKWLGVVGLLSACAMQTASPSPPAATIAAIEKAAPTAAGVPIDLRAAVPIDEDLRQQYASCDARDRFRDLALPVRNASGRIVWFGCRTDPNHLELLANFPATATSARAIVFTSKLGLDLDGSWIACNRAGITDHCGTTLMLPALEGERCVIPSEDRSRCVPVDSDKIPYIVLPAAGPRGSNASEFLTATGIRPGDVGVVIYRGRIVPVIAGDTGPFYKIGEGSMGLHRLLGIEFCKTRDAQQNCTSTKPGSSIASGVTTIIFPGTRASGLNIDTIGPDTSARGQLLYNALARAPPN